MNRPLRIVAADDEPVPRRFYQEALGRLGHEVHLAADGRELVERCRAVRPDLVITDIKMPGLDGLDAAAEVCRERPVPVVLVSAYQEPELTQRAADGPAMAYLVKPIEPEDLAPAITLALRRFAELQDARRALEDRKLIERAKGAVMRRLRVGEDEAFRGLRRLANNGNRKLTDVAAEVLAAEEMFLRLERCGRPGSGEP
jgi:two-component system, response regulator PdtaR